MDLPMYLVLAVYRRLSELGVIDARTRVCMAQWLLLHGPDWDDEANAMLEDIRDVARRARVWDSPWRAHHPVFLRDFGAALSYGTAPRPFAASPLFGVACRLRDVTTRAASAEPAEPFPSEMASGTLAT